MTELKYGEKEIAEARLEFWSNPNPEKDYTVEITFPEFTCLCPRSGYPDLGTNEYEVLTSISARVPRVYVSE